MSADRFFDIGSWRSVLVVDEPGNAAKLKAALEPEGFEVFSALNAGEARILTRTREPAFVLTELILPRETGFELCAYLKSRNDTLPVVILTEVDLDAARNLAIWCGADAYLAKPVDGPTLAGTLHEIARLLAERVRHDQQTEGEIQFRCTKCNKRLSVKPENANRLVRCKGCQSLTKAPAMNMQAGGFWRKAEDEEEENGGDGSPSRANFFCDLCGHMLDVFNARADGAVLCGDCGKTHRVPKWVIRQRKFFFRRPKSAEKSLIEFNPARYVTVRCEKCHTHFQYFPSRDKPVCPHCHEVNKTVSLKGSPLSRAALVSTGRMFGFTTGPFRNKRFLLPEGGELVIGTAKGCKLRLKDQEGLQPRHGLLRDIDGNCAAAPLDGAVEVNGVPITHRCWLKAGDIIDFGPVRLKLIGSEDLSDDQLLRKGVSSQQEQGDAGSFEGQTEIAQQSAKILQLYWERLREQKRNAVSAPNP